jgi:multidrug transporter EmrE-like cation transporter
MMIDFNRVKLREMIPSTSHLYLLVISIFIQAFGAICTKYAAISTGTTMFFGIRTEFIIYFFILGGMGLQVIFWQKSLKYYSLSFAYPFRSLVSFIVLIAAFILFGESITLLNVVGLAIITFGIFYLVKDKEILQ